MSDVVVSVTDSTTDVTVSEQSVAVAITEATTQVSASTVGLQGIPGATGATGATGASGVISVTAPITNTGSSSSAILGLDQTALSITRSQVSDFTSGTVTYATVSGSATNASTALTAGTASYANTSLTSNYSGTATYAGTASNAGTASTAGTAFYANSAANSGTATYANSAATAQQAGTAFYSTTSGTSLTISGSITNSQVSDFASGTVANISGTVTQAQVSGLAATLGGYAALGTANTFTVGGQVINSASTSIVPLIIKAISGQAASLQEWRDSTSVPAARVSSSGQIATGSNLSVGSTAITTTNQFQVTSTGTAQVGAVIRGAAAQSANLQEWQNSGGTAIANISSAGVGRFENTGTLNGLSLVGYNQAGGHLTLTRATATMASPGANTARLYFRAGTNANTLKLVVLAGAAGAETTILDNIPT